VRKREYSNPWKMPQHPDGRESRLTGLQAFSDLNGTRFRDLPEPLQDKIRYCQIRAITFKPGSYSGLKFEVFRRLNTGAVSLNDQELRNCIYRGAYNQLLKALSENTDFRRIVGFRGADRRMRDAELVLRFAAFQHAGYLNYRPPMRTFLNRDMEDHRGIGSAEAEQLREAFRTAVSTIRSLLDTHAFKRFHPGTANKRDGYWEPRRFNASLYDILMYSLARENRNTVYRHLDAVREALIDLMATDQEFIDSIELSTSSVQAVTKRFDKWRARLQAVLGVAQKEPRCFSSALKKEMYDRDPTCQLCGQAIRGVDDAALDHAEQYWLGGKTIPENARLAHRYCNMARPRRDQTGTVVEPAQGETPRRAAPSLPRQAQPVSDPNGAAYLLKLKPGARKGISARCRLELRRQGEQYTILAGSQAVVQAAPHFPKYCPDAMARREQLLQTGVLRPAGEHLEFAQDCGDFTTPSAAAEVILGRSANGYICWPDAHGRPVGALLTTLTFRHEQS